MDENQDMFEERYRKVLARHRQLSRGYVTRLGKNGVINHQPIPMRERAIPLPYLLMPFAVVFLVKGSIFYVLGDERYAAHLALLSDGGFVDRMGSVVMKMDPFSSLVAGLLTVLFG